MISSPPGRDLNVKAGSGSGQAATSNINQSTSMTWRRFISLGQDLQDLLFLFIRDMMKRRVVLDVPSLRRRVGHMHDRRIAASKMILMMIVMFVSFHKRDLLQLADAATTRLNDSLGLAMSIFGDGAARNDAGIFRRRDGVVRSVVHDWNWHGRSRNINSAAAGGPLVWFVPRSQSTIGLGAATTGGRHDGRRRQALFPQRTGMIRRSARRAA